MTSSLIPKQVDDDTNLDFDVNIGVAVSYLVEKGYLHFKGTLNIPPVGDFYEPVKDWIEGVTKAMNAPIRLYFELSNLNNSATRFIYMTVIMLQGYWLRGLEVQIIWQYNEQDLNMRKAGEIIADSVKYPVQLIAA